jgi:hypothetical protein
MISMNARTLIAMLLAASAAATSGCLVDNNASVVLAAACFPPTPNPDGSCSYPAACDSVMLGNLWVDTTYAPTGGTLYWPVQVNNQRPDNGAREGGTTTSTAYVTGYKLKYFSATVALPETTVIWSTQSVPPVGSTVVIVPVIPAGVATLLSASAGLLAEVRVEIRAKGHYGDGSNFETGPFSMVVNVVNGAGSGVACVDPATPTPIGVCPQPGQSGVLLCK